jgi:hypothetical protein
MPVINGCYLETNASAFVTQANLIPVFIRGINFLCFRKRVHDLPPPAASSAEAFSTALASASSFNSVENLGAYQNLLSDQFTEFKVLASWRFVLGQHVLQTAADRRVHRRYQPMRGYLDRNFLAFTSKLGLV